MFRPSGAARSQPVRVLCLLHWEIGNVQRNNKRKISLQVKRRSHKAVLKIKRLERRQSESDLRKTSRTHLRPTVRSPHSRTR